MKITKCILCTEATTTTKDGICPLCWHEIYEGKEPTLSNYIALDIALESFPRSRKGF